MEAVNRGAPASVTSAMRQEVIDAKAKAGKASKKYEKSKAAYEALTGKETIRSQYVATRKSAAVDRRTLNKARDIDEDRVAANPGRTPGSDFATLTDMNVSRQDLNDSVDQRRSLGETIADLGRDPMDKTRNDKNLKYPK